MFQELHGKKLRSFFCMFAYFHCLLWLLAPPAWCSDRIFSSSLWLPWLQRKKAKRTRLTLWCYSFFRTFLVDVVKKQQQTCKNSHFGTSIKNQHSWRENVTDFWSFWKHDDFTLKQNSVFCPKIQFDNFLKENIIFGQKVEFCLSVRNVWTCVGQVWWF